MEDKIIIDLCKRSRLIIYSNYTNSEIVTAVDNPEHAYRLMFVQVYNRIRMR